MNRRPMRSTRCLTLRTVLAMLRLLGSGWRSIDDLATALNCSVRTARRYLVAVEGELALLRRAQDGRRLWYRLDPESVELFTIPEDWP